MPDRAERWQRLEVVVQAALERPTSERAAFLAEACGGDDELRREAASLIDRNASADGFLAMSIGEMAAHAMTYSPGGTQQSEPPREMVGRRIGSYEIRALLGAGGMGEVYRAHDHTLGRDVAVKLLPAAFSADRERLARFEREARLLASLSHPHIGAIHGLEGSGEVRALVLELIDGETLQARLGRGPLPTAQALTLAVQIAEALDHAHRRGVTHRDLKPGNIMLTKAGVKLLDFGLAKWIPGQSRSGLSERADPLRPKGVESLTEGGMILGTPHYMAPEQLEGKPVDARVDVFAFGAVLYEMLTGRKAFSGGSAAAVMAAVLNTEPAALGTIQSLAPRAIERVIRKCLAKNPDERWQTTRDLADELKWIAEDSDSSSVHHIADARLEIKDAARDAERRDWAQATRSIRRRARVLGASTVALALVLAGALGAWLLRRPVDAPALRVAEITTPRTSDLSSFALSPDGRRLAFVADHHEQPSLWIRELDSADAHALPGTEGARRPFWSPDSRSIGFFKDGELQRIEARGGAAQKVTDVVGGATAAWGPDATILFSSSASAALHRVNASGGNVAEATLPTPDSTGQRHPQFLPGGRQFLFFVGGADAVRGVYLGSFESPEVRRLVPSDTQGAYVAPGWLLFIRQGTLWAQRFDLTSRTISDEPIAVADSVAFEPIDGAGAFSTSDAGVITYRVGRPSMTRLSWFDRSGNALGTFGSPEQMGLTNLRLSPDGRRVVVERSLQDETDLWLLDSNRQTRLTHASDGRLMRLPLWSPDGSRIAFESVRPDSIALSAKPANGDGEEDVLFQSSDVKVPCDWSPDGKLLMYYVPTLTSGTDLWVLPRETNVPLVFLKTQANELWGQFSPNGRWIAYQSNETGRYEIYVRPLSSSGGPTLISAAGGVYPRWSRDGTELYFIAPDATMMAASIRATTTMIDPGVPTRLFQTRRLGGGSNVIGRGHQYEVAQDGRFLINVDMESAPPPITLMMNWKP